MKKLFRCRKATIFLGITLLSVIVMFASIFSEDFAEFMSRYISGSVRTVFGRISSLVPFSLAEIIVCAGAVYIVAYIAVLFVLIVARLRKRPLTRRAVGWLRSPIVVFAIIYCLFIFTLMPSYHRRPIDRQMGYDAEITGDDVFSAFEKICAELDTSGFRFDADGSTVSGRDFDLLAEGTLRAARDYADGLDWLTLSPCRAKPILLSEPMTYTRITGFYGFFTGECNVITTYPDFVTCYTLAHEYCHAMGVAPENECNFLAFVMLRESGDEYLRYSALANMLLKLSDDAYRIDPERYESLMDSLDDGFVSEYNAYVDFWNSHENEKVSSVSTALNDVYLKVQGQSGVKSYSDVTALVAEYYRDIII